MAETNPIEILEDPLSTITRKERRNLLLASTIGWLVTKAGFIPKEISTLLHSLDTEQLISLFGEKNVKTT